VNEVKFLRDITSDFMGGKENSHLWKEKKVPINAILTFLSSNFMLLSNYQRYIERRKTQVILKRGYEGTQ
jgi:hypothetical protein